MLPVPAVVRVTAHNAVRDDKIAVRQQFLATAAGERVRAFYTARGDVPSGLFDGMPEGLGMWRAQVLTITGPVITGRVPYAVADPGNLERHYGVKLRNYRNQDLDFVAAMEMAGQVCS